MVPVFRCEPMLDILAFLEAQLTDGARALALRVLDPDLGRGRYTGERVEHDGETYVHRPLRVWLDLAERLRLRLGTPRDVGGGLIELRFEALDRDARWRASGEAPVRYAPGSEFARIDKLEEPRFVMDVLEALGRARLGPAPRVLDLGVNTGSELALILRVAPGARIVGVDHSAAALAVAKTRFPAHEFVAADVAALPGLGLGRFDLVISLDTLQSAGIDDRAVLRQVVQDHLAPDGAVIIGLPNARYVDGEIEYGARMVNFTQPELGLLVKDLAFYRKYLQQHHRQVFVTGKYCVLVTGVIASGEASPENCEGAPAQGSDVDVRG